MKRIARRVVAALAVAVLVVASRAAPSSASTPVEVGTGQVVVVSGPFAGTVPTDGRLRGPDAGALVTQVAWPVGADGYVSALGDRLVEFAVSVTEPTADAVGVPSPPSLWLSIDASNHQLDTNAIENQVANSSGTQGTGAATYLTAVPDATHDVGVSLIDAGFTQTLSLWTLKRTTPAPTVLYENPSGSTLSVPLAVSRSVPITTTRGPSSTSIVHASSAVLSAFGPGGSDTLAPPGHDYLTLQLSSGPSNQDYGDPNWGTFYSQMTPIPGSAITFTTKNGRRYVAERSDPINQTNNPDAPSDDGMVDAIYSFLIPSRATGGIVSIGPATTTGVPYVGFVGSGLVTLHVGGPVRLSIGLPRASAPAVQRQPPWVDEPVPPSGAPDASGAEPGLPVGAAIGVLVGVALVALLVRRRTRARRDGHLRPDDAEPTSRPVPATCEDLPAPAHRGVLRIEVLGPVRIAPLKGALNEFSRAFLCYLALHADRPRSAGEVQTALWPDDEDVRDVTHKTFLNHVSRARQAVGRAHLPSSSGTARYALIDACTDWQEFRSLVVAAASNADARVDHWKCALTLVRGVPFESEVARSFQWTDTEALRSEMTRSVVRVAIDLHAHCVQTRDLDGAEWALRQGLRSNPVEFALWECMADVVQARGDPSDAQRFWRDATAVLDEAAVEALHARVLG